jgi:hypothetical protein
VCYLPNDASCNTILMSLPTPDQIKSTKTEDVYNSTNFIRSPSKNLGTRHEAQHMFVQGLRSLFQFVPGKVNDEQIKDVICCLLEVSLNDYA